MLFACHQTMATDYSGDYRCPMCIDILILVEIIITDIIVMIMFEAIQQ